ncbi:MAG: aegerolysin family protein [Bacteroidia bacterium]
MSDKKTASAATAEHAGAPQYEYLQVRATVINFTDQSMILTGSDLTWGKWINSPVDTPSMDTTTFGSQGRDSSPSGTTGWATWTVGGATITVNFDCPLHGSNSQSITCSPATAYKVASSGTGGDVNSCTFKVMPA